MCAEFKGLVYFRLITVGQQTVSTYCTYLDDSSVIAPREAWWNLEWALCPWSFSVYKSRNDLPNHRRSLWVRTSIACSICTQPSLDCECSNNERKESVLSLWLGDLARRDLIATAWFTSWKTGVLIKTCIYIFLLPSQQYMSHPGTDPAAVTSQPLDELSERFQKYFLADSAYNSLPMLFFIHPRTYFQRGKWLISFFFFFISEFCISEFYLKFTSTYLWSPDPLVTHAYNQLLTSFCWKVEKLKPDFIFRSLRNWTLEKLQTLLSLYRGRRVMTIQTFQLNRWK